MVFMQTFVPVPGSDALALVSCSSPVLPLVETWLNLFDAIASTFDFVETRAPGCAGHS